MSHLLSRTDIINRCLERGCSADFWINIALCVLGWIPGIIHAWYIISKSEGAM
ncbi:uncharacterized protein EV420DRAFT_1277488 [Desarmillaria tabescens]|uniref:Uncharacterized protein n=1 Tax=Armillaria tabescens TaxID=1929756 RepID=A0AA39JME1_ARMTA|nr:uncharacterized protein EV420DRAFT_1277488 [Desarmillaria tabescens]KAK0444540.1 hypothetical protein EV420DRAFT_1277488 [Desarmillaria tabescens]